jgi:hypothetical protein
MENHNLIDARLFCECHKVEISFVRELDQLGIIHLYEVEQQYFLDPEELPQADKLASLHTDLGINPEGLDVIHHLLSQMEEMRRELSRLHARLQSLDDD